VSGDPSTSLAIVFSKAVAAMGGDLDCREQEAASPRLFARGSYSHDGGGGSFSVRGNVGGDIGGGAFSAGGRAWHMSLATS